MTDYTKLTDFASKDTMLSGNPSKIVKGTEIDAEFDAIAVAVATKADSTDLASIQGLPTVSVVSGTSQTTTSGTHCIITNVAATTITLPASPTSGDFVFVTWTNSLTTNVIARNGNTIMGDASDLTLDAVTNGTVQLRFVDSSWRIL